MTMQPTHLAYVALFLSIICRSLAFVFAKMAANATAQTGITQILINPWYWSELAALGGQVWFWLFVLRHLPLSTAYPVTAIVYVLNLCWAAILFGENVTTLHMTGYGLIMLGIVLAVPRKDEIQK